MRILRKTQSGSALLITLLIMGILMTLTLGISSLVIKEIRLTQTIVDANKAYYSAEAGIENALLGLSLNFKGYETPVQAGNNNVPDFMVFPLIANGDPVNSDLLNPDFSYKYRILNTTSAVPNFSDEQPVYIANGKLVDPQDNNALAISKDTLYTDFASLTFKRLGLNQTDIIPLFSTDPNTGEIQKVQDFIVQYYVNFGKNDLADSFKQIPLEQLDILRWKIYGKSLDTSGLQRTESIADFFPAVDGNNTMNPVCIGTDPNLRTVAGEQCIFPLLSAPSTQANSGLINEDKISNLWSAARECYLSDAGQGVTQGLQIKTATQENAFNACNMRDFIDYHDENYLVLTNWINPDIVGISDTKNQDGIKKADIYYRILSRNCQGCSKLVRDAADIQASGFSANDHVIKSLNVQYKAPGFLPVFNFSLYKTKEQ